MELVRYDDLVEAKIVTNRATLARWRKDGTFPEPMKLPGGRSIAWRKEDIERWVEERAGAFAPQAA
jgi:predicted DNA-binding transcriptional regulator AlpA